MSHGKLRGAITLMAFFGGVAYADASYFDKGTFAGKGLWKTPDGETKQLIVTQVVEDDGRVRTQVQLEGQAQASLYEVRRTEDRNGFFSLATEGGDKGSGYCIEQKGSQRVCNLGVEITRDKGDRALVQETLIYDEAKETITVAGSMMRLGDQSGIPFEAAWTAEMKRAVPHR